VRRGTRAALAALALLLAAGEASAQFGGGMGGGLPGGGRRGGMRGGSGASGKSAAKEESRVDVFQSTLEELRIDLHLDAAQQNAWNTYADRIAALLQDVARERSRGQPGVSAAPPSAPQQLDQLVMSAQNHATALEEVAAAAKALYATLNPEQKTVADGRLAHVTSMAAAPQAGAGPARSRSDAR